MSRFSVTLIDVGWGDSVLLAWEDAADSRFALIDSNDSTNLKSSYVYLKRFFEKQHIDTSSKPVFEFVILSHAHADHGQGLKRLMREFGTRYFWSPKSMCQGLLPPKTIQQTGVDFRRLPLRLRQSCAHLFAVQIDAGRSKPTFPRRPVFSD